MDYRKGKVLAISSIFATAMMVYLSLQDPIFNNYKANFYGIISSSSRSPLCHNILTNLTNGKWIKQIDLVDNEGERERLELKEQELDRLLAEYRINRGIHTRLWRNDSKCGYKNVQLKPKGKEWGGPVGAWCDAKSLKPCCDDKFNGVCGNICDCMDCIDMRKIYHAEVSEWIPSDARCHRRNYTSHQACEVLRNVKEIHFVGDSFVRKMLRGFVILLRSDPEYGALAKRYDERLKRFCTGFNQFLWKDCNLASGNLRSLLINTSSFCGRQSLKIQHSALYKNIHASKFLKLVKNLAGKNYTYIFLGVGFHDGCKAQLAQKHFLDPAFKYLQEYNKNFSSSFTFQWPHIIFLYPDTRGLMKSLKYQKINGKTQCDIFANDMKIYCQRNNISVLDFSKLTSGVHSYDGAHHGIGVNIMKVQIMLNYLDSIMNYAS